MDKAATRFQKILNDNNLSAQLTKPQVRYIENGGLIIEPASLFVFFTDPTLEEVKNEPIQPPTGEQSAKAVE